MPCSGHNVILIFSRSLVVLAIALISTAVGSQPGSVHRADPAIAIQTDNSDEREIRSEPLIERGTQHQTLFQLLSPADTGIHFQNLLKPENVRRYLSNGAGVAVGDYDGDGRPDIYLVGQDCPNRLYRQVSPFRFNDVTDEAGVSGGDAIGAGASFVDIENDGDLDLYVCNYLTANQLYVNEGDGTFSEKANEFGLGYAGPSRMGAFADYDRDGDLDLYLLNNRRYHVADEVTNFKAQQINGRIVIPPEMQEHVFVMQGRILENGAADILFENDGKGHFHGRNKDAGIVGYGMGLSATWWDYNNDGWPDLWVGNDLKSPDYLYLNNCDGTFTNVIEDAVPYTTWFSMGADFADFNNDGLFDFLIADMSFTTHRKEKINMGEMDTQAWFLESAKPRQYMRNCLFLNTGTSRFMEVARLCGLAKSDWTWSVKCGDLDNDGRSDVFMTNGTLSNNNDADWMNETRAQQSAGNLDLARQLIEQAPMLEEENLAFRNTGDLEFHNVSSTWGLNHLGISHGAALVDFDRDGDLDLVVNNYDEPASVYRNRGTGRHGILVALRGRKSNQFGVGAKVTIESDAGLQMRILTLARGYLSADEPILHFGLGKLDRIRTLRVDWPSGIRQTFSDLPVDQLYTIRESDMPTTLASSESTISRNAATHFVDVADPSGLRFRHVEAPFDDFQRELLLPNRLSTLGPGLAWGDADGDGHDDLYIGGAAGQSGQLYRNLGDGRFQPLRESPWQSDRACEDMAALWLDVDSDNDMDLYVVSGSNECEPGDPVLRDRLYLNSGRGDFTKAPADSLPEVADSGSVAAAADFDRDGDLDLFVGSRMIPGQYPMVPSSRLLRNDKGRLVDATATKAEGLEKAGLVTSAVWSDVDDDAWPDLLIAREWGPIQLFKNDGGRLIDRTRDAGLAEVLGWWNGITAHDLDGDGDVDYVASNFGLNTKYNAPSPKKPVVLYYEDFDSNGRLDLVEAKTQGKDGELPIRGRSCCSAQIPFLREKFPTFRQFADATLAEMYTSQALSNADKLICTELRNVILVNDGRGIFRIVGLPRLQQTAPAFGTVATDFNADGVVDIFTTHNFYGPQPETGRMSGGLGMLLRGVGEGKLEPVWPNDSGLIIPEDARSVTLCDLNNDNRPDLVVSCNNDRLRVFRNQGNEDNHSLRVRLKASPGNPRAVGARVSVNAAGKKPQTAEVLAGSGYLSQSTSDLFFGLGDLLDDVKIHVRWPNGEWSTTDARSDQGLVVIVQPERAVL